MSVSKIVILMDIKQIEGGIALVTLPDELVLVILFMDRLLVKQKALLECLFLRNDTFLGKIEQL